MDPNWWLCGDDRPLQWNRRNKLLEQWIATELGFLQVDVPDRPGDLTSIKKKNIIACYKVDNLNCFFDVECAIRTYNCDINTLSLKNGQKPHKQQYYMTINFHEHACWETSKLTMLEESTKHSIECTKKTPKTCDRKKKFKQCASHQPWTNSPSPYNTFNWFVIGNKLYNIFNLYMH